MAVIVYGPIRLLVCMHVGRYDCTSSVATQKLFEQIKANRISIDTKRHTKRMEQIKIGENCFRARVQISLNRDEQQKL